MRLAVVTLFIVLSGVYLSLNMISSNHIERISTTNSAIALQNLDSQINSLLKLISQYPQRDDFRCKLFDLLSTKILFTGNFRDFKTLRELADSMANSSQKKLYRARFYSKIHEFKKSNKILSTIDEKSDSVRKLLLTNKLGLQSEITQVDRQQLALYHHYSDFMLLAEIEAEQQNFVTADEYFEKALASYHDSSPFFVAHLFFRRGLMWSEKAGKPKRAVKFYEEAVHYMPQYVTAQVHRAELMESIDDAIATLNLIKHSYDPEPLGLLAKLHHQKGEFVLAEQLTASAKKKYKDLLGQYPKAFAKHYSEFSALLSELRDDSL